MKKINEKTKIYSVETNVPVCPQIEKKDDSKIFEIKNQNNIITFDKHKPNVVGEDAHICLERNQSRNNIKFDKHNPNVVGADASVHLEQNQNNIITFDKHCRGRRPRRPEKT